MLDTGMTTGVKEGFISHSCENVGYLIIFQVFMLLRKCYSLSLKIFEINVSLQTFE